MAHVRMVWLLSLGLVFAGCLGAETTPLDKTPIDAKPVIPKGWAEAALFEESGHSHRDPLHHEGRTTANFEILGWDPLVTDHFGRTSGGHLCGDTAEKNGRRLAVIHSWVSEVAAILIDVTDATKPQKLGEFVMKRAHVYDIGMSPDQRFVLLATDTGGGTGLPTQAEDGPSTLTFVDACGESHVLVGPENELPMRNGIVLLDIADPKAPKFADYLFLGGGHSIQVKQLGSRTFALVTTPTLSLVEVVTGPNGGKLSPTTVFAECGGRLVACNYHDGALGTHPITKQNLAYLGSGDVLAIFDLSQPNVPRKIGSWNDWAAAGSKVTPSFLHEAYPLDVTWDGRHYTFIGEECGRRQANTPTCVVVLLDTTDPTKPTYVGTWTLPVDIQWSGGFLFSLHYIGVSNRTLFVANYHGGLWAVDVSTPEALRTMPTIGVFVPTNVSPKPVGKATSYDYTPAILDVNPLSDGTLITYDHTSGVYAVRFDASNPAPPPPPWPVR